MANSIFGKCPLTVFRVENPDQGLLMERGPLCDMLHQGAFSSIAKTTDARGFGFVTLENHRSTDFGPANVDFSPYHVFSLRIDERKVPPAALKETIEEAIEDELRKRKEIDPAAPWRTCCPRRSSRWRSCWGRSCPTSWWATSRSR